MMQNIYTAVILIITSFLTLSAGEMQTGPYKNAGYRGGAKIPTGGRIIDLEKEYGVIPDDNQDDSKAIQEAINDQKGKFDETGEHAILLLPRGVINIHGADSGGHLEEGQIFLHVKGVVLRGRGNNPHTGTVVIYKHSKPVYDIKSYEPDIEGKIWPGIAAFRIETRRFFDSSSPIPGSINFRWKAGKNVHMQGGGKKGDEQIKLLPSALEEFDVGDTIWVGAVNTEEFLAEYNVPKYYRRCANPCVRVDVFEVEDIDRAGGTLTINDPLPFDLPYSEGSKVYPKERYSKVMKPFFIEEVGIEDLYFIHSLEGTPYTHLNTNIYNDASNPNGIRFNYGNQAPEYAVHAVLLKFAKNCWVKGVHIAVSGSHPIVTETVYRCTIKDNIMQNSYNKGKGGHGYFRGSKAHECLFENNYQDGVRHFTFQWSADQNVSRYNQNIGAGDLNMHGGFERFNWLEHNYAELSFFHRSWKDPVIGPGTQTWYPIWWGSTLHCSKWAGVSTGPDNVFYNCVLKKQADAYAPMENWGISDTPGVEYHWGWDGEKFRHPRIKNTLMSTHGSWVNTDFSEFPNSGVYKKGKPYKDEKPPQLSIDKVDRENKNYFNLTGKAKDDVACKVEISLNRQHFATAFGMVRWQYPVNVKKMPDGINYLLVRAVDGAGNCTYRALNINKKSDTDNTVRKIAFYPEKIDYSFQSKGKKFINIIRVKLKNTFSRNMSFKTVKAASPAGLGASIVSGSGSLTPQQSREITVKISSSSSEFNKKHYQIFNIISGNKKEELRLQYYPPVPSGGKHPCFVYKPQTFDKLKQDNLRRQWGENAFKQLQKTYNDHREKVLPEKKGKYIAVGKKPRLSAVVPDYYLKKHFKTARSVYYSALLYAFSGKKEYLEEVKKIFRHYGKLYPSLPYTDSHGYQDEFTRVDGGRICDRLRGDVKWLNYMLKAYDVCYNHLGVSKNQFKSILVDFASRLIKIKKKNKVNGFRYNTTLALIGVVLQNPAYFYTALYRPQQGLFFYQLPVTLNKDGSLKNISLYSQQQIVKGLADLYSSLYPGKDLFKDKFLKPFTFILESSGNNYYLPGYDNGTGLELTLNDDALPYINLWNLKQNKAAAPLVAMCKERGYAALFAKNMDKTADIQRQEAQYSKGSSYVTLRNGGKDINTTSAFLKLNSREENDFDCLNMIVSAFGAPVLADSGRVRDVNWENKEWFRSTLAHNTVTVEMDNQNRPVSGNIRYAVSSPGFQAVSAVAPVDRNDKNQNINMQRTVLKINRNCVLDFVNVALDGRSIKNYKYDLAYHFKGDPAFRNPSKLATPDEYIYKDRLYYRNLQNVKVHMFRKDKDFVIDYKTDNNTTARFWHKAGENLKVICGTAPAADSELYVNERTSSLILRKEDKEAAFTTLINPFSSRESSNKVIRFKTLLDDDQDFVYQVTARSNINYHIIKADGELADEDLKVAIEGEMALVKQNKDRITAIGLINCEEFSFKQFTVELKDKGSVYITREKEGLLVCNLSDFKQRVKMEGTAFFGETDKVRLKPLARKVVQ